MASTELLIERTLRQYAQGTLTRGEAYNALRAYGVSMDVADEVLGR